MANPALLTGLFSIGEKIIDSLFPNASEAAEQKAKLAIMAQEGQLKELEISMSAILAEANSKDPWTSRARPSFMYLFYLVIAFLVIVFPFIGVFAPDKMALFYSNVALGFEAIPAEMWTTFTFGYLGYSGARSYEKAKGVAK